MIYFGNVAEDWHSVLRPLSRMPSWLELENFVDVERLEYEVYPAHTDIFRALRDTPLAGIKTVILGQDPYHDVGQAHGLAFSVPDQVQKPPSLRNILFELNSDLQVPIPKSGNLARWAREGVLLLNTVLTVRAHSPGSHKNRGWEQITNNIIKAVVSSNEPVAFILWGRQAQAKRELIDDQRHLVVEGPHPSPLSAHRGFFGSRPFSRVNRFLEERGRPPIDWRLQDE